MFTFRSLGSAEFNIELISVFLHMPSGKVYPLVDPAK